MSGGVDSSITAYLLQKEGYEVEGIYMKLHENITGYHEKNISIVKKVAEYLEIPYHILSMTPVTHYLQYLILLLYILISRDYLL